MRRILAGTDTEYGILVEQGGVNSQIEDSQAFVRAFPDECFLGWDYRFENPRNDLRGFELKNLAIDPNDAKFDSGKTYGNSIEIRSDRVLPNGARFYNDHGHPEYATAESFSIFELAELDREGEEILRKTAAAFNRDATLYKNNTDYHGSAYGTHEGYLVPRKHSFEALFNAVSPMLIIRQILTGAGKVGSETKVECDFQLSQRADFFVEPANAETLWRRPIFNTRDEPHADANVWIRLHIISGDANMNPVCTALRVGLVKLALHLLDAGISPIFYLKDPVSAFQSISRDLSFNFQIEDTNAFELFYDYFRLAETMELDEEMRWVIDTSRQLLHDLRNDFDAFAKRVDWATKYKLFRQLIQDEGLTWKQMQGYDLEYSNINKTDGLFYALEEMDEADTTLPPHNAPKSRAFARGIAISKFKNQLTSVGWRGLTFGSLYVELPPNLIYPDSLASATGVESFIQQIRDLS
jgi:Pup amidohydrolase